MQTKEEIYQIQLNLDLKLEELVLKEFGFKINFQHGMHSSICPIHNSSRLDALSMYNNQGTIKWSCFSKKCHDLFIGSSIGFIRGLLSKRNGWAERGDVAVSFAETIQFIREKLRGEIIQIAQIPKIPEEIILGDIKVPREEVRKRLRIPSPYFVKRGFCPKVLDFYDVGPSFSPSNKTFFREIVPIYHPNESYCLGCTARTVFPICPVCQCYHDPKGKHIPSDFARLYSKWKNLNFKMRYSLYNYWNLPPKLSSLIIVEGPGNVWKLVEAGIKNVVGIYSAARINEYKEKLIKEKGVDHLYLGFDNDDAGDYAFQENGRLLWEKFNIHKLTPTKNDFGDMTADEIKKYVLPQIKWV